jgi:anthranilate synthase component 1
LQIVRSEGLPVSRLRVKKFPVACSPTALFLKIQERYEYAFLLESMTGPRKLAQFSFVGFMPRLVVTAQDGNVTIQNMRSNEKTRIETSAPLLVLKDILGRKTSHPRFRFVGGAVGYISYDAVRYWEKLPNIAMDDLQFPNIDMGVYDDGVMFDHVRGETFYFCRGEDRSEELVGLAKEHHDSGTLSFTRPEVNIAKHRYEESVNRAKAYIASGDIFQVVLSKRRDFKVEGDLTSFYLALRRINPSPYMYCLKMGERKIIGSSPEMLVRVQGHSVETFPIAGTRPRVEDPVKNKALAEDLLSDPKERAEHVMLVDLARNDIGRVSGFGSVHVSEFMEVHEYSHVQHIVSRVVGELRGDCSCFDALRAVFPAGTVSGAPKVRAMEIIEESEPTRRGPYAGAVGYFSYNGNADFAITIRTLVADRNRCFIQAGGGIVADSVPEKEWFETEHKARALMKALELSEGEL